jgi:hypothetical protein
MQTQYQVRDRRPVMGREFQERRPVKQEITSHAAGAVILRVSQEQRKVYALSYSYTMQYPERVPAVLGRTTVRFPMETQADWAGDMDRESPKATLDRCIGEEVVKNVPSKNAEGEDIMVPSPFKLRYWPVKRIVFADIGLCEKHGGLHLKLFQMLTLEAGELRTGVLFEDGVFRGEKTRETLGVPAWIEIDQTIDSLTDAPPAHYGAARSAFWKLANENPELDWMFSRYGHALERHCPQGQPPRFRNPGDDRLVVDYVKRLEG